MAVLKLPPEWLRGWCDGAKVRRGVVGDLIFLLDDKESPVELDLYRNWAYLDLKPGETGEIECPPVIGKPARYEKEPEVIGHPRPPKGSEKDPA